MTEPIRAGITWTGHVKPEDDQAVRLYSATLEVIRLLGQGWTRNLAHCDLDEYCPEVVRWRLRNWPELAAAANGMSSAGAEPIGSAGEVDARRGIVAIKADLERGTDAGLADILHWQQVARIYRRQERFKVYLAKRSTFDARDPDLEHEPWTPLAEAICIERIARRLGWRPHYFCEAA